MRSSAFACKLQLVSSKKMRENFKREYINKRFFGLGWEVRSSLYLVRRLLYEFVRLNIMKNQVLIKVVKTKVRLDLFCFLN